MAWYTTGTINTTKNSKVITGIGTKWTNPLLGVSAGRMLIIQTLTVFEIYEIESVQSDTQLTLSENYKGATETEKVYKIPTSPTVSIEQLALEISATLGYYQKQLEGWQSILTGDSEVTLTAPNGQTVTIKSQLAISKELMAIADDAKNSAEKASESAISASTSALNANKSEKNAAISEENAKTSEKEAGKHKYSAAQSALEAKNAASSIDTSSFVKKSGDDMAGDLKIKGALVLKQGDGGLFSQAPVLLVGTDLLTDDVLFANQTFTLSGTYVNSPADGVSLTGTLKITRCYYDTGAAATLEISHMNNTFYKTTAYKEDDVWKSNGWIEQINTNQSYIWSTKQTFKGGIELSGDETSSWVDIGKSKSNGNRYLSFYFYDNPTAMTGPWTSGFSATNDGSLWINPRNYAYSILSRSRYARFCDGANIRWVTGGEDCFVAQDRGSNTASGTESNGGCFSSQWGNENAFAKFFLAHNIGNFTEARIIVNDWGTNNYRAIALRNNGNCYNYSGSFINASDERLKENFKPMNNALDKVLQVNPVYYNRIDNREKTVEIGVKAQEIQKIFPEVVKYNAKSITMNDGTEIKNVLGVDYGAIAVTAIAAIQELNAIVKQQSTAINQLEKQIKELKKNDN